MRERTASRSCRQCAAIARLSIVGLSVALIGVASTGCDDGADPAVSAPADPHHDEMHDEHAGEAHGELHDDEMHDEHAVAPHDPMHDEHAAEAPGAHHGEAHDEHAASAHHEHGEGEATGGTARALGRADGPAGDAVRAEMQALHAATQSIVSDVVDGRLDAIPSRLRPVHGARQATVAAVEAHGYAPPGAPDDLAGFEAADDAFHESLVGLLNAARADDLPETTRQLGVVLSGCTSCHSQYRFVETP